LILKPGFIFTKTNSMLKKIFALFSISFAFWGTSMAQSKVTLKTSDNSPASCQGIKIAKAEIMVDTTIRVKPVNAYMSMEFSNISGTTLAEVLNGNNHFWVYDDKMKEIKIADKLLKKVNSSMENSIVNLTVKIPYRLKTDTKKYIVKYRWESPDKRKWIEVTTTK